MHQYNPSIHIIINLFSRENLMLLKSKKDDPTDQIFVFFPEGEKVGVKEIRKYVTHPN
jgi:DNA-directed RNA polymerase I, II, and III subunit RPABC1